jgi:hypothetical protein
METGTDTGAGSRLALTHMVFRQEQFFERRREDELPSLLLLLLLREPKVALLPPLL